MENLQKTPLYNKHIENGGKMVNFGGWALPVQYSSIIEEHQAVRERAGLFDVSHMGEIRLSGPGALALVQKAVTNDVSRLSPFQALYTPVCLPRGGVVDDILVYRLGPEEFLLVVNAATKDKDYAWFGQLAVEFSGVSVEDISSQTAQLALQGPRAAQILARLTSADLTSLRYYWVSPDVEVGGVKCMISRTGYTGEDGFELYCPAEEASRLWDEIMSAGEREGLLPCGLGARDTLRFEAAMPLYGHELSENITPLEAGLERFVSWEKDYFIGKEALLRQKKEGVKRRLVGFEMVDRGIPRQGYAIARDGQVIGEITSGTQSPTLGKALGMGYVPVEYAAINTQLEVIIRGRSSRAKVVPTPFYRRK
ncbi:glycine cleavage system aminomethyltransferase GcvT [Desulfofundulus thermosubterraneus]|uniref:Aminomethyltransferase n=1 Tax=Desulfofundulus thermosubterraneus DSM 16057 TaxID=1121432 RepID=A0A1M6KWN4_9FIRM|nr:glycine cleavage system aminomethyltransferase GcvT [Desulfofundulus thermosubterraneus]SHJ63299.1 aminomethyltransferase [Desulfofundulus thermosubterraneus DSM 16057]